MASIPDLRVHLRSPDNDQFRGRCTELDSVDADVHASVEFPSSPAPAIGLGKKAHLSFRGGGLVANIDTEGVTVARSDDPTRRRYSFTLVDVPKELLLVLTNRRHAPRVKPDEEGLRVQILHLGVLGEQVQLHDISGGGLSVLLRPAVEERLSNTTQVQIALSLPDVEGSLVLNATIRNRRLSGPAILYGLQFDREIPGFADMQKHIAKYLTAFGG